MEAIKLNIGGGPRKYEGFLNVDVQDWNGATDVVYDLTTFPYPFDSYTVDEIIMMECLEHITFKKTVTVLNELFRILKVGGTLRIQVPDCGKAMEYYVNGQICKCVPQKADDVAKYVPDPSCWACSGKGKIHPIRWLYSFVGAQKHPWDSHLNVFTQESLADALGRAGFVQMEWAEHPYKLIVTATKHDRQEGNYI